jgi:hypothetical protein
VWGHQDPRQWQNQGGHWRREEERAIQLGVEDPNVATKLGIGED